eukprot:scaffold26192_cov35-Phaeocystis_antarctica.AAC.3
MEVIVCPTRSVGVCPPLSSRCHVIASRSSAHISLHGSCRPVVTDARGGGAVERRRQLGVAHGGVQPHTPCRVEEVDLGEGQLAQQADEQLAVAGHDKLGGGLRLRARGGGARPLERVRLEPPDRVVVASVVTPTEDPQAGLAAQRRRWAASPTRPCVGRDPVLVRVQLLAEDPHERRRVAGAGGRLGASDRGLVPGLRGDVEHPQVTPRVGPVVAAKQVDLALCGRLVRLQVPPLWRHSRQRVVCPRPHAIRELV